MLLLRSFPFPPCQLSRCLLLCGLPRLLSGLIFLLIICVLFCRVLIVLSFIDIIMMWSLAGGGNGDFGDNSTVPDEARNEETIRLVLAREASDD